METECNSTVHTLTFSPIFLADHSLENKLEPQSYQDSKQNATKSVSYAVRGHFSGSVTVIYKTFSIWLCVLRKRDWNSISVVTDRAERLWTPIEAATFRNHDTGKLNFLTTPENCQWPLVYGSLNFVNNIFFKYTHLIQKALITAENRFNGRVRYNKIMNFAFTSIFWKIIPDSRVGGVMLHQILLGMFNCRMPPLKKSPDRNITHFVDDSVKGTPISSETAKISETYYQLHEKIDINHLKKKCFTYHFHSRD